MITSRENKLIKYCIQVKDKKESRREKVCFVETYKIVKELIEKKIVAKIFCVPEKLSFFQDCNIPIETINSNIAKYLSDTITTDGVFALCRINTKANESFDRMLILDNIQDPTNMGAIIRSACAFGFDQIFAINCVYPYTPKGIRCSMGQIFNVNFVEINYENLIQIKTKNNIKFVCADMNGIELDNFGHSNEKLGIIIGNEGQGVSDFLKVNSEYFLSIPMQNNVESLNASVSASIIMYYLRKMR